MICQLKNSIFCSYLRDNFFIYLSLKMQENAVSFWELGDNINIAKYSNKTWIEKCHSRLRNIPLQLLLLIVWIWEFIWVHVTHITVIFIHTANLHLINQFLVKYRFSFPVLNFLVQNHLKLFKDQFLRKMLLKRAEICRFFKA